MCGGLGAVGGSLVCKYILSRVKNTERELNASALATQWRAIIFSPAGESLTTPIVPVSAVGAHTLTPNALSVSAPAPPSDDSKNVCPCERK